MNKRCRRIWETASEIVLGKVPTESEIVRWEEHFQRIWDGSGQTDFSFYDDPNYMYLALNSWQVQSAGDIEACIRNGLFGVVEDGSRFEIRNAVDFCGGVGMTACLLATEYPSWRVVTHNIAPKQREAARELARRLDLPNVHVTERITGNFDLVIAQETFEHFKDPFRELNELLDETQPIQYLDATHFGFSSPGHFDVFLDGQEEVPREKAKRRFNKLLRSRGFEQYWIRRGCKAPFNGHPSLWEL